MSGAHPLHTSTLLLQVVPTDVGTGGDPGPLREVGTQVWTLEGLHTGRVMGPGKTTLKTLEKVESLI